MLPICRAEEEPEEDRSSKHNSFLSPCFLLVVSLISLYLRRNPGRRIDRINSVYSDPIAIANSKYGAYRIRSVFIYFSTCVPCSAQFCVKVPLRKKKFATCVIHTPSVPRAVAFEGAGAVAESSTPGILLAEKPRLIIRRWKSKRKLVPPRGPTKEEEHNIFVPFIPYFRILWQPQRKPRKPQLTFRVLETVSPCAV